MVEFANRTPVGTVDGLYNFRDVGGMPLVGGGSTRSGVLFRSDALSALTAEGLTELSAAPIGVIVDFRTPAERDSAPDRIPQSRPIRTVNLSIIQGAMADTMQHVLTTTLSPDALEAAMATLPSLDEMYLGMLAGGAPSFALTAQLVAQSRDDKPTAVLVHCTAGKDRTGVATALLLMAVGVRREAVVADYAESQMHLAGAWADAMTHSLTQFGVPLTPALLTLVSGTPPEAIEAALDWVDSEYGGAASYLASGGLAEADLAALRARLRTE